MLQNYSQNLQSLLTLASNPNKAATAWSGAWHLMLANLAYTEEDNLVVCSNLHIGEASTGNAPPFTILDVFAPNSTPAAPDTTSQAIVLILESAVPEIVQTKGTFPLNDPNISSQLPPLESSLHRHIARAFSNPNSSPVIYGIISLGYLWAWVKYTRAVDAPVREEGQSEDAYLASTPSERIFHEADRSVLMYVGTHESDSELARLQGALSHS